MHLIVLDKFIPPFIKLVNDNFLSNKHRFLILGTPLPQYNLTSHPNVEYINSHKQLLKLLKYLYMGKKLIIHGLWDERMIKILYFQPWLLRKCYHVMWGGDFYNPEAQSQIKKKVIRKIGHFITHVKGDFELVKKWYGAKGILHKCFVYPSNLYTQFDVPQKEGGPLNILLGNSCDPSNRHIEVIEKLISLDDGKFCIICPLSYGGMDTYKNEVINQGKAAFGERFKPLVEFLTIDKYAELIGSVDIAVFAHNRQQAMGNIVMLLGMGKKVYLRTDTSHYLAMKELGLSVFDFECIDLSPISLSDRLRNKSIIISEFSKQKLLNQLGLIFDSK